VRKIVADGILGDVVVVDYLGQRSYLGDEVTRGEFLRYGFAHRSTMLSIIGGHALAAVQSVIGPVSR